jgi:heme exporter protein A
MEMCMLASETTTPDDADKRVDHSSSTPSARAVLTVTGLCCTRGGRSLFKSLAFAVHAGQLLHVQGRNGSGKTTLLRTLCGLLPITSGQINWCGQSLTDLADDYYRDLLYIGHLNAIKDDLTGLENLQIAMRLAEQQPSTAQLQHALTQIGLTHYHDVPCRFLSQGQKKRVALARLALTTAPLWILDEPFTALDYEAVDYVRWQLANHLQTGGLVILTTHQEVNFDHHHVVPLMLGSQQQRDHT